MSDLDRKIEERLRELIEPARTPEFMARLRRRIIEDKPILDRLRGRE